jgi:hypothetical protein
MLNHLAPLRPSQRSSKFAAASFRFAERPCVRGEHRAARRTRASLTNSRPPDNPQAFPLLQTHSGCAISGTPSACAQMSGSQHQGERVFRRLFAAICSAAVAVSLFAVAPRAQGMAASSSSAIQSTTANSGGPGSDQTGTVPTTLPTVRCTPVAGNSPSAIASGIGSQESSGSAGATGTTGIGDAKAIGTNVGISAGTPTDSSNAVAITKRSAMMTTGGVPCVPGTGPGATTNPPLTPLTPVTPVPTGTSDLRARSGRRTP